MLPNKNHQHWGKHGILVLFFCYCWRRAGGNTALYPVWPFTRLFFGRKGLTRGQIGCHRSRTESAVIFRRILVAVIAVYMHTNGRGVIDVGVCYESVPLQLETVSSKSFRGCFARVVCTVFETAVWVICGRVDVRVKKFLCPRAAAHGRTDSFVI